MVIELKSPEDFKEFLNKAGSQAVFVDFYAKWCGPCKMIAPKIEEFSEIYKNIHFAKIDVDIDKETSEACDVAAMPTFIVFKEGKEVDKIVGANKDEIEAILKKYN